MLRVMLILALRPNRQRKIRAESAGWGWLDRCARPFESPCSMSLASSTGTSSTLALTYVPPPTKCLMGMQWIIGWQLAKRQPATETESWHEQTPLCAALRRFFLHTLEHTQNNVCFPVQKYHYHCCILHLWNACRLGSGSNFNIQIYFHGLYNAVTLLAESHLNAVTF